MIDESDWRLAGDKSYLKGVELRRQKYRQYPENPGWDHDHCRFCWAKFALAGESDALRGGYCTPDEYYWICEECFGAFRERFEWRLIEGEG